MDHFENNKALGGEKSCCRLDGTGREWKNLNQYSQRWIHRHLFQHGFLEFEESQPKMLRIRVLQRRCLTHRYSSSVFCKSSSAVPCALSLTTCMEVWSCIIVNFTNITLEYCKYSYIWHSPVRITGNVGLTEKSQWWTKLAFEPHLMRSWLSTLHKKVLPILPLFIYDTYICSMKLFHYTKTELDQL